VCSCYFNHPCYVLCPCHSPSLDFLIFVECIKKFAVPNSATPTTPVFIVKTYWTCFTGVWCRWPVKVWYFTACSCCFMKESIETDF
jgi:hypothetical protein